MLLPEAREEPLAHPDFSQAEPWFDITVARKGFQDPRSREEGGVLVLRRSPRATLVRHGTKTSEPPSLGAMKQYPRSVLKNLTRPLGMAINPIQRTVSAPTRAIQRRRAGA
jgi:hypothetical protein